MKSQIELAAGGLKKFKYGNDHNVFLVTKPKDKFVLKQYRFRTETSVKEEASFIDFLHKKRCRVPKIYGAKPNDSLSFPWNGEPSILMSYLRGKLLINEGLNKKLLKEIGKELGQMDRVSRHFPLRIKRKTVLLNDILLFHPLFRHKKVKEFNESSPSLRIVADDIRSRYNSYISLIKEFPRQPIHNDICEKNIIIRNGKLSGFIDFSDYIMAAPIVGLAAATAHLSFNQKQWEKNLYAFIKAYRHRFNIKPQNIDFFIFLMEWRLLSEMATNFYLGKIAKKARNTEFTNRILWKKLTKIRAIPYHYLCDILKKCFS